MEKDIVKKFVKKCNLYGVTLNERYKPIYGGSGVRLGVQLIARYKWQKKDIELIADILFRILKESMENNEKYRLSILNDIKYLSKKKKIHFTFNNEDIQKIKNCSS